MAIGDGEDLEDAGFGETSRYAAHLDRGWSLLDRSDFVAARQSATHAQRLRPDAPDAAVLLAAVALAEGDPAAALRYYDLAIELDPDYFEPYHAAAQIALFDLGDAMRALHYCDDALELDTVSSLDALDLELLGSESLLSLGRDEEARARLETLREHPLFAAILHPPDPSAPSSEQDDDAGEDPEDDDGSDPLESGEFEEPATSAHDEDFEPRRIPRRSSTAAAIAALSEDEDGEPLDPEERTAQVHRVLGFALRLGRLWLDLGLPEGALPLLRASVERFPNQADAWHILSEAEFLAGDVRSGCHAALRVYRLDAQTHAPKWLPSLPQLHRKVIHILSSCNDETLRELGQRRAAPVLLVHDVPALELILEGVDPRVPAMALATRDTGPHDHHDQSFEPNQDPQPPELTGLAIYRRNIMRLSRNPEHFDQELRFAVLEELAGFFQLDDPRRMALGLPPLGPHVGAATSEDPDFIEPPPPPPEPKLDEDRPRSRRRKRILS